jgi:DNA replication protein DnaC
VIVEAVCPERQNPPRCQLARADKAVDERASWLGERGLTPEYERATLDGVLPIAGPVVAAYLDGLLGEVRLGRGLYVRGTLGTGKSSVLGLIMRAAYDAGMAREERSRAPVDCWFVHCERLYRALLDRAGKYDEALWQWRGCQLLLLDDWGAAYESPWAVSAFSEFMEDRYARRRSTCVTTNSAAADLDKLPEWDRVRDRWRQRNRVVQLVGPSRRRPDWEDEGR